MPIALKALRREAGSAIWSTSRGCILSSASMVLEVFLKELWAKVSNPAYIVRGADLETVFLS